MGILERVIGRFGRKNELHSSRSIELFTKYGLCRAKMYLYKIEASKRDSSLTSDRFVTKEIIESYSDYAALMCIIKKLGITKLHLVSSNPGVALQIQRLGLELEAWSSVISFDYGDAPLSRL